MVEIPEGVWTRPLEIEQKYQVVHKEKEHLVILAIEKGVVSGYYDILKFLELGIYPEKASNKEHHSIRMMVMQYILSGG